MGYECKVYIVTEWPVYHEDKMAWGDILAVFDLSKMGYDKHNGKRFDELFKKKMTCEIYPMHDGCRTVVDSCVCDGMCLKEDACGDEIKKANMDELIAWLEEFCKHNDWWKAKVLLDTLRSIKGINAKCSAYLYGY